MVAVGGGGQFASFVTRRAGRIRTGPYVRGGAVMWPSRSIPTVWPPRAGLRPSTLRRRSHPRGLWNHRGDRLAVGRWDDPNLDTHREQVRYNDYRCSVPGRFGLEGATVRWHGHTDQPEPDTGSPSGAVNEPSDAVQLGGGLIAYKPTYTTSAREESSGARPTGDIPRKQNALKQRVVGRGPPLRRQQRWTPERHNYETRATSGSWAGPDMAWVGSNLARRFGWHVAEQAALEVDRVVQLGRPVQNRQSLATRYRIIPDDSTSQAPTGDPFP